MSEFVGVVASTAPKYLKGAADNTIRGRLLLKKMQKENRIVFNENSYSCTWDVQFAQQQMQQYGDAGQVVFNRSQLLKQPSIDWRGYYASDLMTEKERLMNSGTQAIVNRYARIIPSLAEMMRARFNGELISVDGYATGNGNRVHGLETLFSSPGTTVAADRVAPPGASYGGISEVVQSFGGTWSTSLSTPPNASIAADWPEGNGDSEYDFFAPKMLNWSSTSWGTGSTAWLDNCWRCLTQMHIWLTRAAGAEAKPTMDLIASNLLYDYKNFEMAKQRVIVPHKEAEDLGFSDVLNQDGVMIATDFDVLPNTGYSLNIYQMELACMYDELFKAKGPEYSIKDLSYLFLIGFFGNMRFNPKYFGKFYNYA